MGKTNVAFDGSMDDDSPVHGSAISFAMGDYLHVMERYDQNWWIGRKVQIGADIDFIPSPAKLETLRIQLAQNRNVKLHSGGNKPSSAANLSKFLHSQKSKDATSSSSASAGGGGKNNNTVNAGDNMDVDDLDGDGGRRMDATDHAPPLEVHTGPTLVEQERKKKGLLGKKVEQIPPYDVVPSMRPVVIIGPSLKGYEVTDMMQKALFEHIKRRFESRVIITRVSCDVSLAKKNNLLNRARPNFTNANSSNNNNRGTSMEDVQNEIERI